MKVIYGEGPKTKDPVFHLGFEKYEDMAKDCYLFVSGYSYGECFEEKYHDKKRIFLTLEEPNWCQDADGPHAKLSSGYGYVGYTKETSPPFVEPWQSIPPDEVLTLCPYTAELFDNRTPVFFPFNDDYIPSAQEKIWDVIYSGNIPGTNVYPHFGPWPHYIDVMRKYNYRYIHFDQGTNPGCSYEDKIQLYSQSKIALVHNLVNVNYPQSSHLARYWKFPKAEENEAFRHLNEMWFMPQIKSRTFEAAFTKCIILCSYDHWNIIEQFFEPDKEFLYFSSPRELDTIIQEILCDYKSYEGIAEAAYERAIANYTTKHFVEKYIGFK